MSNRSRIVVLDFGSQYAHLIAKRFRLLGYYSEIAPPSIDAALIRDAKGIVLSGGPSSVYEKAAPDYNPAIFDLDVPLLGLCYGHQLMARVSGGTVERGEVGEFGIAHLLDTGMHLRDTNSASPLFTGVQFPAQVWMSHQDAVIRLPAGWTAAASTKDCPNAAIQNIAKRRFGLQFHVEVKDTLSGGMILKNFAVYCGMKKNWEQDTVLDLILQNIITDAAGKKVLLFLSGGVDSTVAFALLNKALGQERVLGLHIDNGFMRKNESTVIAERYKSFGFTNFIVEDASESFLNAVKGETDPQIKRRRVGENFITVRNEVVKRLGLIEEDWLLAQGTLYPDIIESGGTQNSHTIKTHHNRVEGIQALIEKGLIIEPLKDLYKDEVRIIGKRLNLPHDMVMRHPFPGPGLSINVLCSNGILSEKTDAADYTEAKCSVAEFSTVYDLDVLPVKSVGVQGDYRTYRFPAVLSLPDIAGAADWDSLEALSSAITNGNKLVNRAVIELFHRPGTALALQKGYCDRRRLDQTREADAIVLDCLKKFGWYYKIFQHLTINLPFASSPERCSLVLRPVVSEDVMTARFAKLDPGVLQAIVARIAALSFVDALYYDITNKPPATFGWE
jgi:GMP synthase (glutamine-hydrolysing)